MPGSVGVAVRLRCHWRALACKAWADRVPQCTHGVPTSKDLRTSCGVVCRLAGVVATRLLHAPVPAVSRRGWEGCAKFGALNGTLGASSGATGFAKPRCDFRPLVLDPSYMSERLGDLTSRERELVDAVALGDVLECSQLSIERLSASDDPEHIVRAELLRELLLKRCDTPQDPRGLRVRSARITGTLDLNHVEAAVGLELRDCSFENPVLLEESHLPWLTLTGSSVPALNSDGLRIDGSLLLDEGFRVTGPVRLGGAHITGSLSLTGAELANEVGPALHGVRLQVGSGLFLDRLRATGHGELGAVRLSRAHITGLLSLEDAELTNETGPALVANRLQVDGDLLGMGLRATGCDEKGAVDLLEAHMTGSLSLSGAKLTNKTGPALAGVRLQVNGGLFLSKGFRALGHGECGAVQLWRARITGPLTLSGAELTNKVGPALHGDRLQVDSDLFLDDGFRATGYVRLSGARIGGLLTLRDARLISNEDGFVVDLGDMEVKRLIVPPALVCPQALRGRSPCEAARNRIGLSGLVYTSLEDSRWSEWLHLIARHTSGYRPQPYQQLASVRRAAGHDADARKILIAQQQDLYERGDLGGWLTKTVHRTWGALGGYGYLISRIALALLVVLFAAAGLGIVAGHILIAPGRYVAMHTAQASHPDGSCSLTEQIGIGIDRGLPLGSTGIRSRCDFDTTTRWGQVVTGSSWVLQFLVWALATLFVAGYVGLIRKAT